MPAIQIEPITTRRHRRTFVKFPWRVYQDDPNIEDYAVAQRLLDAASHWVRRRGMTHVRGPTNFTDNECPGILPEGADCPPAMLEAHTPPYYRTFLERYGMAKDHDLFSWRAFRSQIGEELEKAYPELFRVAEAAREAAEITIRTIGVSNWDQEVLTAFHLFNTTLEHLPDRVPLTATEFRRLANQMRPF